MTQRTIVSRWGEILVVRPMTAADDATVAAAFATLSATSLRRRFFTDGIQRFSHDQLADLVGLHPGEHVLLAHDVAGRLAGGARLVPVPGTTDLAEVAVTVGDDRQGHGIGPRLLDLLAADAAVLGYRSLRGHVLVDNARARSMVGRAGGHLWFEEPGVLGFEIPLALDARTLDDAIARSLLAAS